MFSYVAQGFMLGLAYLAPIGMQNTYVINTAAQSTKSRAIQVALITAAFDIALAFACFFGVGFLLDTFEVLKMIVLGVGALAVFSIGVSLIQSVPEDIKSERMDKPIAEIIVMVFVVTWLNPQAIIDGSLLLGGFKASLTKTASTFFILGVSLASISWFTGLSVVVNAMKDKMTVQILRGINVVCGGVIILFSFKLGWMFVGTYLIK